MTPILTRLGQSFGFSAPAGGDDAGGSGRAATGGTKTTSGAYTIHTFNSSGVFTVTGGDG